MKALKNNFLLLLGIGLMYFCGLMIAEYQFSTWQYWVIALPCGVIGYLIITRVSEKEAFEKGRAHEMKRWINALNRENERNEHAQIEIEINEDGLVDYKKRMEDLKEGGTYLIDELQADYNTRLCRLQSIQCIQCTNKAYQLKYENGNTVWVLKEWGINIIEEL